ncbi:hypothetical protein FJQ54_09580 [Sandaracinobacter neustonicus]|uniref:DUF1269 domain-containing protein n=1 Tax=Sandaracinobacter neustonicus TaxID=1715348 RepID=A0A501XL09_9SPHN|nr:DUF6325 family protein [Sandaracinobacter neustonicus]TPE61135.1 hypothetical protein FJQ54_09580 [Sandaracinobacter neustonicus]
MTVSIGPVEFLLLGFEGNRFNGAIAPALGELVGNGLIRLLDVAVVIKDADGHAAILEMQELPEDVADAIRSLTGESRGLMSEADLLEVADNLEPETTVAALLVEHIWASRFSDAVRAAGGELLVAERIPGDLVDQARAGLAAAAQLAGDN